MSLGFGKYKGVPLNQVPVHYLEWALANCKNLSPQARTEIEELLHPPMEQNDAALWLRMMAKRFHPDVGGTTEQMKVVNQGYDLLRQIMQYGH